MLDFQFSEGQICLLGGPTFFVPEYIIFSTSGFVKARDLVYHGQHSDIPDIAVASDPI
jgi:hypothetical protein